MIELTVDEFRKRFPEFANIQDDTLIERAFKLAGLQFDFTKCDKEDGEELAYLLAAHWLTINLKPGTDTQKSVVSESLGAASKTFGSPTSTKYESDPFMSTKYGQQFNAIFNALCKGLGMAAII
jgi:hypothetical protein